MEDIKIIKNLINKPNPPWPIQRFVVLNRMPKFLYEKVGDLLVAQDGAFYDCYYYEKPYGRFKAFAGREFEIPMKNGSVIKATGQWWSGAHPKSKDIEMVDYGYSTIEELKKCFVFIGGSCFDKRLLESCTDVPINYHCFRKSIKKTNPRGIMNER